MGKNILSIDIGGTKFSLALCAADGVILDRRSYPTNTAGGARWMVEEIYRIGSELIAGSSSPVVACGIGFGGPVDFYRQIINRSIHVHGWSELPLARLISERFQIPAILDNDANAAALGEVRFGAARGCSNIVYLTVSTGIGGGIIIGGDIYHGSRSYAGECGHITVLTDGAPQCSCGKRGCLEALCSGASIGARARAAAQASPESAARLLAMAGNRPENITAKLVFDMAGEGDEFASGLVKQVCSYLGLGVATFINLFDPEMVVIGGGVSKAGATLFEPLKQEIEKHVMPIHSGQLKCVKAALEDDSVLLGAVALANRLIERQRQT